MPDKEDKPRMFGGIAKGILAHARATPAREPETTPAAVAEPTTETPASHSVTRRAAAVSRATPIRAVSEVSRRNNLAFTQMSAYVATDRYGQVRKQLVQHPRYKEMGALLDELFARWLREGAQ
jgi:hypothetical protein